MKWLLTFLFHHPNVRVEFVNDDDAYDWEPMI
jgi:hypothetical protein